MKSAYDVEQHSSANIINGSLWMFGITLALFFIPAVNGFYNSERYSPEYTANSPAGDFHSASPHYYPQRTASCRWHQ